MKKNCIRGRGLPFLQLHPIRKFLLIVKASVFISLLFSFSVSGSSVSNNQNSGETSLSYQQFTITGKITDAKTNEPLPGVTIKIEGTKIGAVSSIDGTYSITVPNSGSVLIFSYVGYLNQKVIVQKQQNIDVKLEQDVKNLDEVIVVGYGQQKKESVVGAIVQTNSKVLERTGGVSSLGAALTGNLPGVIAVSSTGMPGAEDPKFTIRSATSWNGSDPLILVDGIERPISSIEISSVESVSVLKDASATAVYGVKGANGVILITTKRGKEGKANIQLKANTTAKFVSKLPEKYDSYDALMIRNMAVERELGLIPTGWSNYKPMDILNKYRNPANAEEWDRYANVDWVDELFEDYAMSYNASANISGGTENIKYFTTVDVLHEGDMFKSFPNNRGYSSGYDFNRINVRANLDFKLTKTTKFSTNLFGSNGVRKSPWGASDSEPSYWASAYRTAPDAFRPIYSDGTWGFYSPKNADVPNSMYILAVSGIEKRTTNQINTDFILTQELDMITKGLSIRANVAFDNSFRENSRGINDQYNNGQRKWINPETGVVTLEQPANVGTQLDFDESVSWSPQAGSVDVGQTYRKLYYSMQLNYERKIAKHNITFMGLFSREKNARGPVFPGYREDWAARTTYNYALKYFFETSGAYNGSEKFGPGYRFAFFPSVSAGWAISEEKFMKSLEFIGLLKIRGSWGRIGSDQGGQRFGYEDSWAMGGNAVMGTPPTSSPYPIYRVSGLGNSNLSWETAEKRNIAVDYSFLEGLVSGSVDFFSEHRTNILVAGNSRAIPTYFGVAGPDANLGTVNSHGYEIELKLNKSFASGIKIWSNASMTHAKNKIEFADDPQLMPDYQKRQGYAIGQTRSYIDNGYIKSWDDLYGSTVNITNNNYKLPGDYIISDFNGDGIINNYDAAPYQYTGIPQNTYNLSLGFEWKGLSLFVQFYGVNNVSREVAFPTFHSTHNIAYVEGTYWSKDAEGDIPIPRWSTSLGPDAAGTRYWYDGSYVRLKNAEIAYTFKSNLVRKMGFNSCRIYVNGSNLLLWTSMPDDRESNFSGSSSMGAYPTVKRINLGIDITL